MSLRQVCNVAFVAITQWMSEKDRAKFDRELLAGDPQRVSHGTDALMRIMGVRPPTAPAHGFEPNRPRAPRAA